MPYKIVLDVNGKEVSRGPLTRGRPPKGSYKDNDGNLICPIIVSKVSPKVAKKEKKTTFKTIGMNVPDEIPDKKKIKSTPDEAKITYNELINSLFIAGSRPNEQKGDLLYMYNIYVKRHIYLDQYKIDLFNANIPLMIIDRKNNIISIWKWYGPKKEDKDGNVFYDFNAVDPGYIVKDLIRPE